LSTTIPPLDAGWRSGVRGVRGRPAATAIATTSLI